MLYIFSIFTVYIHTHTHMCYFILRLIHEHADQSAQYNQNIFIFLK